MAPAAVLPSSAPPSRKLRFLALHSFRTSGRIMELQMASSGFARAVEDLADVEYLDAPMVADTAKVPRIIKQFFPDETYREWWNADTASDGSVTYNGLFDALKTVRDHVTAHGPYDGVMGFSQGGSLAELLCRSHWHEHGKCPFACAVVLCSFACRDSSYRSLYPDATADAAVAAAEAPGLSSNLTPTLFIAGGKDTDVPAVFTERLARATTNSTYLCVPENPHVVPRLRTDDQTAVVRSFLKRQLDGVGGRL